MNTQDKLKKAQEEVEKLKLQIQKEERNKTYGYGRLALKSDEANFFAKAGGGVIGSGWSNYDEIQEQGRAFTTHRAAQRFLKAERLAFKCRQAMAKSFGGEEIDWLNPNQIKYCLHLYDGNAIGIGERQMSYMSFCFKTRADAKKFIDGYSEQEIILMLKGGDV